MTHLTLFREAVDLLESRAGDPTLEDAIVLFCVHVEGLLVNRRIFVYLVNGGLHDRAVRVRRCAHVRGKGVVEEPILRRAVLRRRRCRWCPAG